MSIIKSSQPDSTARRVRALSAPPPTPTVDPQIAALREALGQAQAQTAALAAELAERDAQIERLGQQGREAVRAARAEGQEAGLLEAEDTSAKRLERLETGLSAALERFATETQQMERLALALASEGLGKLIGDPEIHCDLLARTIRHHVDAITNGTVIEVAVARTDFTSSEDLARLAVQVGRPELKLVASQDLGVGDCQIRLKLGALDIGLDRQWERLNALFAELGAAKAAV